jgi:glycosyltransferase involved in cell wall biosynthesis
VLIYLAPNRWDGPRQRPQHLAAGLARTRPVIFVEPAAYTLPGVFRRRLAGESSGPLFRRVKEVSDTLRVYSPPPTVPGSLHLRTLNALVHALAWRDLRRAVPAVDSAPVDVLVGWPPAFELARRLHPRRLIYDCMDLFPSFEDGLRRRLLASSEDDVSRAAFAVVVTSRELERRWSQRHLRVVRIPNGVELDVFRPGAAALAVPSDIARLPRPRLGYIGTVGRWVDVPLLQHVARQRPGCSIVLVGPVEPGITRPSGPANLRLLGERPYASLPAYLAGIDVLLIPFRLLDLTRAVNPIKLYEYCTTGKPIVATPIEEVVAERGLCHLGEGHEAFLKAVDDALLETARPDPLRIAARQAVAQTSGWDRRVAAFMSLLDEPGGEGA